MIAVTTPARELVGHDLRPCAGATERRLTDSSTGEPLEFQPVSAPESVEAALQLAVEVHASGQWSRDRLGRSAALLHFGEALQSRATAMAEADSLDSGVPIASTTALISGVCAAPSELAGLIDVVLRQTLSAPQGEVDQHWMPWGPTAVLTPFNAPAPMAILKTASAIAAGAPVILKPSEWTPRSATLIAEAALEAGLPPGAVQVVQGDRTVGKQLVEDHRIASVSFTGGLDGGRAVALSSAALLRPVELELSGINPVLVLPRTDLQDLAEQLAFGMQFLNGQWCAAPRRVLVPGTDLKDLRDALISRLASTAIGSAMDPSTTLGPVVHAGHLDAVNDQVAELQAAGAEVDRVGHLPDLGGHFMSPVVITSEPFRPEREMFGPVVTLIAYDNLDEAILVANDHPFGLSGYVFGPDRDEARAHGAKLRAGAVNINSIGPSAPSDEGCWSPWGMSGLGLSGGMSTIRTFTGARCVG